MAAAAIAGGAAVPGMAPSTQHRPAPAARLYLTFPAGADAAAADRLKEALAAADVAAVLLRYGAQQSDERAAINAAKRLAPIVQGADAALLLEGHPHLAARAGADGAHLTGIDALVAALPTLKPDRIAGAGGLASRHDAMLAGEAGADYVMFGEPDATGRRPSLEAVAERVAWWSELFEIPCVGVALAVDEVEVLARAGADFIALGEFVWKDPETVAATVRAAGGFCVR